MKAVSAAQVVVGVCVAKKRKRIKGIHDQLVQTLEDRLRATGNYSGIETKTYYSSRRECGEIDLYAMRGNRVVVFEIKSSDSAANSRKAEAQLKRAVLNYRQFQHKDCVLFYAYWTDHREGEYGLERVCFEKNLNS